MNKRRLKLLSSKESHDEEIRWLRDGTFDSKESRNQSLRYYCDDVFTKDIKNSLFIILDDDEYRFPTLERSIQRGKKFYWIHDEFVETNNGLVPKWYLESKLKSS